MVRVKSLSMHGRHVTESVVVMDQGCYRNSLLRCVRAGATGNLPCGGVHIFLRASVHPNVYRNILFCFVLPTHVSLSALKEAEKSGKDIDDYP
jgi:hypothetical protein